MHFKKILLASFFLAVVAFGLYGLNQLVNSKIEPVQASAASATPVAPRPGTITLEKMDAASGGQSLAIQLLPAAEIPTRGPDAGGFFSAKDGNTLTLKSFMLTANGAQGMAVSGATVMGAAPEAGTLVISRPADGEPNATFRVESGSAPAGLPGAVIVTGQGELVTSGTLPDGKVGDPPTFTTGPVPAQVTSQQVVLTDATRIYHDVTPMSGLPASGTQTIQQVLEPGTLDGLTAANAMITVWGHRDGEQLIADVILYQNPLPLP